MITKLKTITVTVYNKPIEGKEQYFRFKPGAGWVLLPLGAEEHAVVRDYFNTGKLRPGFALDYHYKDEGYA